MSRVYESVDDRSLSKAVSLKPTKKELMQQRANGALYKLHMVSPYIQRRSVKRGGCDF